MDREPARTVDQPGSSTVGTGIAGCACQARGERPYGFDGWILKICSFKVADDARGFKYGKLLLKTVLRHAHDNRRVLIYVEVLPRHGDLAAFLEEFGPAIFLQATQLPAMSTSW